MDKTTKTFLSMDSAGEESGDDQRSRGDNSTGMQRFEGNSRLVMTHEGNLDTSTLPRINGYMYKKGGAVNARGGFRNWKKRWFVIAPMEFLDHEGFELQYYDAPNGTMKGSVSLSGVDLFCEKKSKHKKVKHEFQIKLQAGGILQLSCDNEEEREEWLESLKLIILFMQRITTDSAYTLDGYDPALDDEEAVYIIGEELAQNCQAIGPGLFGAEAGKCASFLIQMHDLLGQKVTRGNMPITATITNSALGVLYYCTLVDNEDGSYYAQYTIPTADKYQLDIKINNEHAIFSSPFEIAVLPTKTYPKYCAAEGEVLQKISPGNTVQSFTIFAKDCFQNRKERGGDGFEVGIMGPASVLNLVDNSDGTYTCSIETNLPSRNNSSANSAVMIMVTLQGKHIQGSPFKPIIVDAGTKYVAGSNMSSSVNTSQTKNTAFAPAPTPYVSKQTPALSMSSHPPYDLSGQPSQAASHPPSRSQSLDPPAAPVLASGNKTEGSAQNLYNYMNAPAAGLQPMSRLERSRQRALLAKQNMQQPSSPTTAHLATVSSSTPSPTSNNGKPMNMNKNELPLYSTDVQISPLSQSLSPTRNATTTNSVANTSNNGRAGAMLTKSLSLQGLQASTAQGGGETNAKPMSKLSLLAQRSAQTLQAKQLQLQQQQQQYNKTGLN